ncbi:MAG: hypothetical protein NDI69_13625 [Bacteriovoracaceae bacterium]|nr:hypothetical protein [Bacteriovoracaceae bacterium]
MRFLILLLCILSAPAWAQLTNEKTVALELKTNDANEAKSFLLFEAIKTTIEQYSSEIGLNSVTFQSKLDERFNKYFEAYKNRQLLEKFGKNYTSELTAEQKQLFLTSLEENRGKLFIKNARLDQVLDSYAFKEIRRDQENQSLWKATIVLNLNRSKLEKLNKRLMSPDSKQYSKLLVLSEINLIGMNWNELELDQASTFTDPIMDSWLKWLDSNAPSNVEEIALCMGECLNAFSSWQDLPQEEGMRISEDLLNGVWLKVSFNLRKISYSKSLNEWELTWDGRVVLLDMNTKKIIASYNMLPETKSWRGLDQKTLNSTLASAMYRSPLDALNKSVRKIQEGLRLNRLSRLVIQGHSHLGDVVSLIELLKKEGEALNLELQLDLFSQKEAQLLCFYQGEEKSFTDLLSRLKELKSSHSYRLVNEFTGVHHVLKLIAE